jgi:hypothetical protein
LALLQAVKNSSASKICHGQFLISSELGYWNGTALKFNALAATIRAALIGARGSAVQYVFGGKH